MIGSKHLQRGATMWQMAIYVIFFLLMVTAALKMVPQYIDDRSVGAAFEGVHQALAGKDIYEVTNSDIKSRLSKFFQVSMLPDELLKDIDVVREGGRVLVKLDYERRFPFMGNVDIVMRFSHEVDLAEPVKK